jgi:type IV pilus assembly protein PilA
MRRLNRAFSLIELMIVISIIGILSAVAIPAYSAYVKRANLVQFLTTAEIIKNEAIEYQQVTGDFSMSGFVPSIALPAVYKGIQITNVQAFSGIVLIYGNTINGGSSADLQYGGVFSRSTGMWTWACSSASYPTSYCTDFPTFQATLHLI